MKWGGLSEKGRKLKGGRTMRRGEEGKGGGTIGEGGQTGEERKRDGGDQINFSLNT